MTDPRRHMPAYASPLSHDEHAALGRCAVIWGHIDFILDELLLDVVKITIAQRATLIGQKPIGARTNLLKNHINRVPDKETAALLTRFVRLINDTKRQRNHVYHGAWGWRVNERKKTLSVAARFVLDVTNPFTPDKFSELQEKLCECSRAGFDALSRLRGWPQMQNTSRFFHGPSRGTPGWLLEWSDNNQVTNAFQDRSSG